MNDDETIKVLLIEDNPLDVRLIRELLVTVRPPRFMLEHTATLSAGLARLAEGDIAVVLLDLGLTDSTGLDTFRQVHAYAPQVPLVVLTGYEDEETGVSAVREGAQDYLVKGAVTDALLARAIRYAIERKQSEQTLRESERRYRALYDGITDALFVHEVDATGAMGRFLEVNAVACQRLGYTRAELLHMSPSDIDAPDSPTDADALAQRLAAGESVTFEQVHIARDGQRIPVEIHARTFELEGRTAVLSIARDITERKRMETNLRRSEEKFKAIIHFSPIGIGIVDSAGNMTDCNTALAKILGYTRAELLRLNFVDFTLPDDLARERQLIEELWAGDRTDYRLEKRYIHRAGHLVWVDVAASLFRKETGEMEFGFAFVEDITARKLADEQLHTALREKEILLKEVYHRVKNNLQVISSMLHMQARYLTDPTARAALLESRQRVNSMALVHERLYRSENLHRIEFASYLRHLTRELLHAYHATARGIEVLTAAEDIALDLDTAIHCGLIISELVANALKYAFPDNQRGAVRVKLHAAESRYILTVADNGVGLPAEIEPHTTETLGLQLVALLAAQLHGDITLTRNGGATFTITFPR